MRKQITTILVTVLCVSPAQLPQAQAQTPPPDGRPMSTKARPKGADLEYKSERLAAAPQLPNLPTYSGRSKLLLALRRPNPRGGSRVELQYLAQEDQNQVLDWYRQSLQMYHWSVADNKDEPVITATSGGYTATVRVARGKSRLYPTQFSIYYSYPKTKG